MTGVLIKKENLDMESHIEDNVKRHRGKTAICKPRGQP